MSDDTGAGNGDYDDRTIGLRLKRIRQSRRLSLAVVAGLAGTSTATLSRIENGLLALDSRKLIIALAKALRIAPSELMRLPVPAPANGHTDAGIEAVRLSMDAIDIGAPGGLVLPVEVLRTRVAQLNQASRACRDAEVGAALPGVIRDLHTALLTGGDHGELLDLAVLLHIRVTRMWLNQAGAPADLQRRTVFLARRLAAERDEPATIGVAAFGVADVLAHGGAFDLAAAELDNATLPGITMGLAAALTVTRAVVGPSGDADTVMDTAQDMADRWGELGESDPLVFGFGPSSAAFRRVRLALEAGEPDRAVRIAEELEPDRNPFPASRGYYWVTYGRGLAQLRGRRDDGARALRRAELIQPHRIQRDPLVREVLAELVAHSKDDALGREIRGMAYRAGLPL